MNFRFKKSKSVIRYALHNHRKWGKKNSRELLKVHTWAQSEQKRKEMRQFFLSFLGEEKNLLFTLHFLIPLSLSLLKKKTFFFSFLCMASMILSPPFSIHFQYYSLRDTSEEGKRKKKKKTKHLVYAIKNER